MKFQALREPSLPPVISLHGEKIKSNLYSYLNMPIWYLLSGKSAKANLLPFESKVRQEIAENPWAFPNSKTLVPVSQSHTFTTWNMTKELDLLGDIWKVYIYVPRDTNRSSE